APGFLQLRAQRHPRPHAPAALHLLGPSQAVSPVRLPDRGSAWGAVSIPPPAWRDLDESNAPSAQSVSSSDVEGPVRLSAFHGGPSTPDTGLASPTGGGGQRRSPTVQLPWFSLNGEPRACRKWIGRCETTRPLALLGAATEPALQGSPDLVR